MMYCLSPLFPVGAEVWPRSIWSKRPCNICVALPEVWCTGVRSASTGCTPSRRRRCYTRSAAGLSRTASRCHSRREYLRRICTLLRQSLVGKYAAGTAPAALPCRNGLVRIACTVQGRSHRCRSTHLYTRRCCTLGLRRSPRCVGSRRLGSSAAGPGLPCSTRPC